MKLTREELVQRYDSGDRNFPGADLSGVDLSSLEFDGCCFIRANFQHAILWDTVFRDGVLARADFSDAYLRHACFNRTDIRNAVFERADLRGLRLHEVIGGSPEELSKFVHRGADVWF